MRALARAAGLVVALLLARGAAAQTPASVRFDLDATHDQAGVVFQVQRATGELVDCAPVQVLATERRCGFLATPADLAGTVRIRAVLNTLISDWSEPATQGATPGEFTITAARPPPAPQEPTNMALVWDTPTIDNVQTQVSGRTTSHTVGSGANRALWALVYMAPGGSAVSGTPTYNGVPVTTVFAGGGGPEIFSDVYIYRVVAPASGAHDFVVAFSGNSNVTIVLVSAAGVDQATPNDAIDTDTFGEGFDSTADTASATGDEVLDFLLTGFITGAGFTPGAGQTEIADVYNNLAGVNEFAVVMSRKAGASTTTMTWEFPDFTGYYHWQLNVNAAADEEEFAGDGDLEAPAAELAASAVLAFRSSASALTSAPATAAASAKLAHVGTGALTAPAQTAAAVAKLAHVATSAIAAAPATAAASAKLAHVATSALTAAPMELDATGEADESLVTGDADLVAAATELDASAAQAFVGAADLDAPPASAAATGRLAFVGTGALATPAASLSSTAKLAHVGAAAVAPPATELDAAATQAFVGAADLDAPATVLEAVGETPLDEDFIGDAVLVTPPATLASSGRLTFVGSAALAAPAATLAAAAVEAFRGAAAVTTPATELDAAAVLAFRSTAALTAPPAELDAEGVTALEFVGAAALAAPRATLAAVGRLAFVGSGALATPALRLAGSDTPITVPAARRFAVPAVVERFIPPGGAENAERWSA